MILAGRPAGPAPRAAPPRPPAPPKPAAPSTFHDAGPTGDYGGHAVTQFKQTPAYHKAVVDVFKAQPDRQKTAIVQGALHHPTVEGNAVLNYVRQAAAAAHTKPNFAAGTGPTVDAGPNLFQAIGKALSPATVYGGGKGGKTLPGPAEIPGIGTITPFAKGTAGAEIITNAGKDAWNLPGATVQGIAGLTSDLWNGHYGNAFHMVADPFVQFAQDPLHTFENHPLNTYLMFAGGKGAVGRGGGFAARTGALGERAKAAASTVRSPLHLGTIAGEPSPILEARNYSPDVLNKAFQVAREKVQARRGLNPHVSRQTPGSLPASVAYAMNLGTRAKLHRGVDEMTAVHQMEQRAERAHATSELRRAAPSKAARNVVSHVLQGVIRTPKTAVEDATKEINRLRAAQTGKRTAGEIWNRQQVRDLSTAVKTPGALEEAFQSAAKLRPQIKSQDAYLVAHALLDPEQAARRAVLPYAMAHMGATHDPVADAFRNADGSPLSTEEILQHLKTNDVPDPAYVGHFPGKVSPARFYSTYRLARGSLGKAGLTGAAFKSGAYDHTWNGLTGQVASRAQAVTKASLHDRVISRYGVTIPPAILERLGIKSPNGDLTPAEARVVARAAMVDDHGNPIPNALELTPISRAPTDVLGQVRDLQHPQELGNISQLELHALGNAVEDAARRSDGTRNVALIPRDVAQRFAQQYAKTDGLLRSVGRVTQQFRRTVLPYSTHWMTQIGSEAALRAMLGGALDPRYLADGRRLMHLLETDPHGRSVLAESVNATLYNGGGSSVLDALRGRAGRGALDIHNPNAGVLASAAKSFLPSRLVIAAHNRYADTITAAMYGLEHNARLMGLGKMAHKEVQSFGFSWRNAVRLQGQSLAQLAERLRNDPALVAKFGREIDNTFGKYNKFTPMQRAMIQSFTPFLPWYLNAAKYVLWHLPAHHPVASALLASLRQTITQDVQDGKKAPLNAYAMEELARISPFGIFTPPSTQPSTGAALAGQQFTGAFLPQIEGSFYNLAGVNSFGAGPLRQPPSPGNYKGDVKPLSGPAAAAAMENMLEAFLPLARYGKLAREHGKPAYGTSTLVSPQTKPEKGTSVLNRIFNPFYSFERAGQSGPAYGAKSGAVPSTSGGWGGTSKPSGGWGGSGSSGAGGWG